MNLDQSTNRQWSEGTSPLTQVREHNDMQNEREKAATEVVEYRARIMGADKTALVLGILGTRNAIRAGESCHRAVAVGVARVENVMEMTGGEV